ncbi:MAG: phosphomannomutase/phosphoglucomutase [Oligoflexia bacterium]|nr:phosphomannomutase/phosphoglucomutase [Oligoflexia bacterium]
MNATIFREYDIRGIADKDLSEKLAYSLGAAYAKLAKKRLQKDSLLISVGRDCRLTGEKYSTALMKGLTSEGCKVTYLDLVTTPMTYFSIYQWNLDGAIMVTGSHNPPNYNGFKICVGKSTLFGEDIQELKKIMTPIYESAVIPTELKIEKKSIYEEYSDYFLKSIQVNRKLKIVVDAGNGAASESAPKILSKLNCEVIPLFCTPDGNFPNHPADPTVEDNLQDVIKEVIKQKADCGIAFDGDGDRIGVVTGTGRILWGDELMVIFSRDILEKNKGATIISEVKSSYRLYQDIKAKGGNGIMWKTGHSLIKAKMKETGAKLAGEMSGHIFFADRFFGFDDATYAAARFLEILSKNQQSADDLVSDLEKTVNTPEIRVDCSDEEKWKVIDKLKESLPKKYETNLIDGVRVEFGDAWGLVRASNTQPVIVMRFEAKSPERLKEVRSIIENEAISAGLKI